MVTMPRGHGGVARMVAALGKAGIEVIRIEPRCGETFIYQLIVNDRPRLAMSILEGIGCQALGSSEGAIRTPLTPLTDGYASRESRLPH